MGIHRKRLGNIARSKQCVPLHLGWIHQSFLSQESQPNVSGQIVLGKLDRRRYEINDWCSETICWIRHHEYEVWRSSKGLQWFPWFVLQVGWILSLQIIHQWSHCLLWLTIRLLQSWQSCRKLIEEYAEHYF